MNSPRDLKAGWSYFQSTHSIISWLLLQRKKIKLGEKSHSKDEEYLSKKSPTIALSRDLYCQHSLLGVALTHWRAFGSITVLRVLPLRRVTARTRGVLPGIPGRTAPPQMPVRPPLKSPETDRDMNMRSVGLLGSYSSPGPLSKKKQ